MTHAINTPVNVNAYYFAGQAMKTFPREIEYQDRSVTFRSGLRYLVHKGSGAMQLFDMSASDGLTYRLRQAGDSWTLLGTRGGR